MNWLRISIVASAIDPPNLKSSGMLSSLLRGTSPKSAAGGLFDPAYWYDGGACDQVAASGSCVGAGVYLVLAAIVFFLSVDALDNRGFVVADDRWTEQAQMSNDLLVMGKMEVVLGERWPLETRGGRIAGRNVGNVPKVSTYCRSLVRQVREGCAVSERGHR